ncbi:Alkaline ceramidase 3 [Trichoderma lentiforme]|uniref:Alkaline ceramidase 3 n=1 Tax=Trichoderma lentiforme TaxID=1567552 RepID=A0A9P4XKI4_9HYPO|nr:Alkaline ceramidase 3 [Trichoderma lentiforme]
MDASAPADPFWGPQTSYLNFCEEDYTITRYIAEFINTLSSLVFVVYGVYGLLQLRSKHADISRWVPYFGLIGVGLCSAGYHMTLKYHTQMSDELSMHMLLTPLLYRLLSFKASPQRTRLLGAALSTIFVIVMVIHMVMDEFLLHATSFGLGVYLLATYSLKTIQQIADPQIKATLRSMALFGCNAKHFVGLPIAFLLELHGWWHVFTAFGGYIAVVVVDKITANDVSGNPLEGLAWPIPLAMSSVMPDITGVAKQD